jgi:VCBS repeat-containing protein
MPRLLSVTERNDVATVTFNDSLNLAGTFTVQGVARAGTSSTGVGAWFAGTYGALLINANGTYSFRLDNDDPDTNVLAAGQQADDRFTITYSLGGATHTDTITVRITGVDEPGQSATSSATTLVYPTPAIIDPLTQIVSTAEIGVRLDGFGPLHQSINRGSIRVGVPGGGSAWGLEVGGAHWEYYSAFRNDGLIEAVAGLPGANAYALSGSSAAPLVNNGVLRAVTTGEDTFFSARAVGIMGGPHDGTIINNGVIEAISADGGAFGMWVSGLRLTVRNGGLLYVSGGHPQDLFEIVGIRSGQSSGLLIENSGTIHVVSTQGAHTNGITIFRDAINVHAYGTVINSGTIVADTAIRAYAGYFTGIHVTNSGHIEGDLDFDLAQNIVINLAGASWIGDLKLGINEDVVRNAGSIVGNVTLGDEDDLFDGRGGTVVGLVQGGRGFDVLLGGAGADRLEGGDGKDRIEGGGGADQLTGGADADVFVFSSLADSTAASFDTITDFQSGLDRIDLGALAPSSVSFSASGNYTTVTANSAAGALVFRVAGSITQADLVLVPKGGTVTGTADADTLFATATGSQLFGNAGDDVLDGAAGNDLLDGGTGADLMRGGAGDDVYIVDDDGDRHIELEGEGVDEVRTYRPYSLQAFVENLTLLGSDFIEVNGNRLDNIITGHAARSFLNGGDGNDIIIGGGGGDFLSGQEGADIYVYRAVSDSVDGAADVVSLQTGEDRIDLRAVAPLSVSWQETMYGYWQNFAITNVVTIVTAAGTMKINTEGKLFRSDFILGGEILGTAASETVNGTGNADTILGGAGDDQLFGLGGIDTLSGGAGNDRLDGGAGADVMTGGGDDDVYLVDDAGDYVWEAWDGGRDTVIASVSYTLAPQTFVDVLQTADEAGTAPLRLAGNTQSNLIIGNAGDNILEGGINTDMTTYASGGTDTLRGLGGNDIYYVDSPDDIVIELDGQGDDVVYTQSTYALAAGVSVETLAAIDVAAMGPIALTGNELGQKISGNADANVLRGEGGADMLFGGAGNDRLFGGGGNDRLDGGAGADIFVFETAGDSRTYAMRSDGNKHMPDVIADFAKGSDSIDLSGIDAIVGTGANDAFSFVGTGAFTRQAGQLRYEISGDATSLYADLDGDGIADMHIVLAGAVTLTAADFIL